VGHGVRLLEDPNLLPLVVERGTILEVCPTSNVQSGVASDFESHSLPMLYRRGVRTTINTDDPLVSNITLTDELLRVVSYMGLTLDDVKQHTLEAARAAFLPDAEREVLVAKFETWFNPSAEQAVQ
jgi:adenosine deaminase